MQVKALFHQSKKLNEDIKVESISCYKVSLTYRNFKSSNVDRRRKIESRAQIFHTRYSSFMRTQAEDLLTIVLSA